MSSSTSEGVAAGRPTGHQQTIRLATRGSPLALRQTELVIEALTRVFPGVRSEPVVVQTVGDRRLDLSLDQIGGQGVFAKEVQAAVLDGRADAAVHSAKDLPSIGVEGLDLVAVPPRADPRDVLVGCTLAALPSGATVATGSARRRAQLANVRPDLTFVELRGNMERRLARAGTGGVDAVVAAAAALDRLGWQGREAERLPVSLLLPQIGQGALAIECRSGDEPVAACLGRIDHPDSHTALRAERAVLATFGASCAVPVAAWARPDPDGPGLVLEAMVASGDGRIVLRRTRRGQDPEKLGESCARELLDSCGASIIEGWDRP